MKYLKSYEEVFTVDLKKSEQELLIKHAITRNDTDLVEELIKSKIISNKNNIIEYVKNKIITRKINLNLLEIIFNSNLLNKNDFSKLLSLSVINSSSVQHKSKSELMALIVMLLEKGADPLIKYKTYCSFYYTNAFKQRNFFEEIEDRVKQQFMTKSFFNRIIQFIKNRYPDYYDKYLMEKDANKYNL